MEGSLVAYKVFTNGSVLNASEINDNLMNQSVMVFSNSTARAAALTAPVEGMLTWLEDVNRYEYRNGSGAWVELVSAAAWTAYTPTVSNFTLGNGSLTGRYVLNGKTMSLYIAFTLGTTSSIGDATFSLPSGITTSQPVERQIGVGSTTAIAGFNFALATYLQTSTTLRLRTLRSDQNNTHLTPISASNPAAWRTSSAFFNATLEID